MLQPVRIVAPAIAPITVAEAKAHLRVDHSDDDVIIGVMIDTATQRLDGWEGILKRALITQTWLQQYPFFGVLGLELRPVSTIASVKYFDNDNVEQTLATTVYALLTDDAGAYVTLQYNQSWPDTICRPDAVSVTYVAGYGATAADVPAPIRWAMRLIIGDLNEHRETMIIGESVEKIITESALLAPYRRVGF